MKTVPMAWIIAEEWPTGESDPDAHGWTTVSGPIDEILTFSEE